MVANEDRRNGQRRAVRTFLNKRGAGRVPTRVAAGLKRGAQTAGREAGCIRLALDQLFARELQHGATLTVRCHERIVLLSRGARQGLEPMREVGCALLKRPGLHGVGNFVRDAGVQGAARANRLAQRLKGRVRQVVAHHLQAERILTIDVCDHTFVCLTHCSLPFLD